MNRIPLMQWVAEDGGGEYDGYSYFQLIPTGMTDQADIILGCEEPSDVKKWLIAIQKCLSVNKNMVIRRPGSGTKDFPEIEISVEENSGEGPPIPPKPAGSSLLGLPLDDKAQKRLSADIKRALRKSVVAGSLFSMPAAKPCEECGVFGPTFEIKKPGANSDVQQFVCLDCSAKLKAVVKSVCFLPHN